MQKTDFSSFEIFRVVKGGLGTLIEVQTQWTFEDLMEGIEYLDIIDGIEEIANSGNR